MVCCALSGVHNSTDRTRRRQRRADQIGQRCRRSRRSTADRRAWSDRESGATVPSAPGEPSASRPRQTIFEFYLDALNPRKIQWGDEIDRRLAILAAQSVGNPYFRVCAFQTGVILILLLLCWVWWDKMRQIKHVAAECLADVINAKLLADRRALDAIGTYNRHIEMCNRVIEQQESGLASGRNDAGLQQALADLQAQLATERAQKGRLEAELKQREELHSKLEERLTQLETATRERRNDPNAELVARLERAEAELNNRRPARK